VRRGTKANPARLSQRFEPGCDVDAVAEYIASLDDDVADIDAHAKFDAMPCRCRGVAGDHLPLHLERTAYRVDDAGKLGEQSVAGVFDHSAPVLGDLRVDQFGEMSLQALVRTLLIRAHQARIAGNIDRQDGRQSSLDPPLAHLAGPVSQGDLRLRI
jgi:hypothetical protein